MSCGSSGGGKTVDEPVPAKRRRWVLISVLTCVFLLFPVAGYFGYDFFKDWRALNLAQAAYALLEGEPTQEDAREAHDKSRSAYRIRPENLEVVRLTAKVQDYLAGDRSASIWEEAVRISGGAKEDLLGLFNAHLRTGNLGAARSVLSRLQQDFAGQVETLHAAARFRFRDQQLGSAISIARQAAEHPDAVTEHHIFYVQLTQFSPDTGIREQGIDYLRTLAAQSGETALAAARNLMRVDSLSAEEMIEMANRLMELSDEREDRLLALRRKLRAGEDSALVYEQASEEFVLAEVREQLEFARWLNQAGLPDRSLELISEEAAVGRQDLFLVRADALALTGRWSDLHRMLSSGRVPLDNYVGHLFRMRTHLEMGQYRRAQNEWERSMLDATREPDRLWFLERYVSTLNLGGYHVEVLEKLTEFPIHARRAYTRLLELLQAQGNTAEVRRQLQRMHELFPEDTAVLNDLTYYKLLLNEDVEAAAETAKNLINANPNFLAPYMTYALALLRQDQPRAALNQLREVTVDWDSVPHRWRILITCVLAANGEHRWAERYLDRIDRTRLLPEESALIQQSFGGIQ